MNLVQREGKVKSVPVSHLPLREDILYLNCLCALFLNDLATNNGFHSICNYNIAVIIKFLRNVDVLTILNSSSSFDLSRDCNQLSTLNLEANILRINLIRQKIVSTRGHHLWNLAIGCIMIKISEFHRVQDELLVSIILSKISGDIDHRKLVTEKSRNSGVSIVIHIFCLISSDVSNKKINILVRGHIKMAIDSTLILSVFAWCPYTSKTGIITYRHIFLVVRIREECQRTTILRPIVRCCLILPQVAIV